jgi:outer membrane receptor for ferrienterochelin and colicin
VRAEPGCSEQGWATRARAGRWHADQWRFFGNVFGNRISKENLERFEIVRSASSSLDGSYAMGGVRQTPSPVMKWEGIRTR